MQPRSMLTTLAVLVVTLALAVGCQSSAASPTPAPTAKGDASVPKQWSSPPAMSIDPNKSYVATVHTSEGEIKVELFAKETPKTVNNFVFLAREGFYSNVPFHRIIKGFMVQTGDPTGTGRGSPGYRFEDEPVKRDYVRGTVAMANSGKNTNGSQFFIVDAQKVNLPKDYTIFGQVTDDDSLKVLDKIASTPVKASPTGEMSVPTQKVSITSVDIAEK